MASFHNTSILLPILGTVLIVSLSLTLTTATTRDTITPTQPLDDNETLVSAGGTFALGFFTPNNSNRRYIGIWYNNNNITIQKIVWVANRANPVIGSTGQLSVTADGTIAITNRESTVVWSSSTVVTDSNPAVAQLLDTGNFVVTEGGDSSQDNSAWQSFDYPTDTLLPGMKLGLDKTSGLSSNLTAWRSANDPSPGEYCLAMVIGDSPEMYMFNGSTTKIWRSGPGGIPTITSDPDIGDVIYSFVNSYGVTQMEMSSSGQTVPPLLQVTHFGHLLELGWSTFYWRTLWEAPTANPCDGFGLCGNYAICDNESPTICSCMQGFTPKNPADWEAGDYADGCARRVEFDCRDQGTSTDTFLAVNGLKLPESSRSFDNKTDRSSQINLDICWAECLKNCSCTAYALSGGGSGCLLWVTDLLDVVQDSSASQVLYIRNGSADAAGKRSHDAATQSTDAASLSQPQKANPRTVVVIVGFFQGALLLFCFIFFLWRRKKKQRKIILGMTNFFSDNLDEDDGRKDLDLPLFNFGTIAAATDYFSAENKLGHGGFGPVYKGTLGGNKEIAVKRLAKSSHQGAEEFKNEVMLIAKLQNRNLVRLFGCCIQGDERMLIYEYMPNKSLDSFLFEKEKAAILEWRTRYQIIVGITRGLLYLHHDSRYRIIHRDLKASNILLDKDMNPKISDFGMARLFGGDATDYNTRKVVGTYGYMSPEYAMEGIFSLKSDVYSFGVLLLEIISGKKNRGLYTFSQHLNLVAHAWSLWNEGKSLEMVDEEMNHNFPMNDVLKCIKIGLLCVQNHPEDRPLMSSVIEMLGADITSLRQPKQPGFLARMDPKFGSISSSEDSRMSNELTVTLDGR